MHCLLDLGTQKTGSKCRQAFFARQGHRIPGRQLCYPASGRIGAWHRPLYDALASSDWGLLRAIADEAEGQGADLVILSYEELHKLDSAAIASLARCFPQLDALVFLRRQDRFVNSMHNQLHKSHRNRSDPPHFFRPLPSAFRPGEVWYEVTAPHVGA